MAKAEGTACKRPRGVLDPGDSLRVEQCLWDRGGEDRERNCSASGSMLCPLPQLCPAVVGRGEEPMLRPFLGQPLLDQCSEMRLQEPGEPSIGGSRGASQERAHGSQGAERP